MDIKNLKASVIGTIDTHRNLLSELSLKIHSNPELGFKEFKAAAWLTALKKLSSFEIVRKELMIKSGKRRTSSVDNRKRTVPLKPEQKEDDRVTEFLEILSKYKK